jgi:anti-anti-sigma factor
MTESPPRDPVRIEWRDGVVIAHVHGDVDMSNVDAFTAALREGLDGDAPGVVVDLAAARFFDSSGLRALFEIGAALHARGGRIALALAPTDPLHRLLEISGADSIARIEETVERGIAWVTN